MFVFVHMDDKTSQLLIYTIKAHLNQHIAILFLGSHVFHCKIKSISSGFFLFHNTNIFFTDDIIPFFVHY